MDFRADAFAVTIKRTRNRESSADRNMGVSQGADAHFYLRLIPHLARSPSLRPAIAEGGLDYDPRSHRTGNSRAEDYP